MTESALNARDGWLGLRWWLWGRVSLVSWGVFAVLCWAALGVAWIRYPPSRELWVVVGLGILSLALGNVLPAVIAVTDRDTRSRLMEIPEALALVVLCGSCAAGLLLSVLMVDWWRAAAGLFIGMAAFVLLFGLFFPLAVPLGACLLLWHRVSASGPVSATFLWGTGTVALAGWLSLILGGAVLGMA